MLVPLLAWQLLDPSIASLSLSNQFGMNGTGMNGAGVYGSSSLHLTPNRINHFRILDPQNTGFQSHPKKKLRLDKLRHGLFARAGIMVIPSWFFSPFLRSFSTPMCRKKVGAWSRSRGVNRVDGCNVSVQAGYRWIRKPLSIEVGVQYSSLVFPDSNWLGRDEQIPASDFTQIRMHWFSLAASIIREFPLQKRAQPSWSWKLGGTLMLGMIVGDIYRTKLGAQLPSCTFDNLGNLDYCRPYRAIEFNDIDRNPRYFAKCSAKHGCSESDLIRAGRQRESTLPRLLPLINLVTGPKFQINDQIGVSTEFGFGLGFNFSLAVDVAFTATGQTQSK